MNTLAIIPGMQGGQEILLVLLIILLLFGAKKLPEIARSIGKSQGEFKKGLREGQEPDNENESETKAVSDSDEQERKDEQA